MAHDRDDLAGRGGDYDASSLRGDGEGSDGGDGSQRDVDEDIDELLSDEDEEGEEANPAGGAGPGAASGENAPLLPHKKPSARGRRRRKDRWVCEWDHCGTEMPDERTLVKHLHQGGSLQIARSTWADVWAQTMWEAGGRFTPANG